MEQAKEITITYGQMTFNHRGVDRPRPAWAFIFPNDGAPFHADGWSCPRRSAKRLFGELKEQAAKQGFTLKLVVDPITEMDETLVFKPTKK